MIAIALLVLFNLSSAKEFTCSTSTLLYSVKDSVGQSNVVFQTDNVTKVYAQDGNKIWVELPDSHSKTCDFKVITLSQQKKCITTSAGTEERDLQFCEGDNSAMANPDLVAEHLVLVACSSEDSAYAKINTVQGGTHFIVAYDKLSYLTSSPEWDKASMSNTIQAFMTKQSCDDHMSYHDGISSSNRAIVSVIGKFILMIAAIIII